MVKRYATPIALAAAVVIYLGFFLLLAQASTPVRLFAPAGLAAAAAIGIQLMLSRSPAQVQQDNYADLAREKMRTIEELLTRAERSSRRIANPEVREGIDLATRQVPELLARIEATEPSSLYSSASKFEGHVASLAGLVDKYADIEARPRYYENPEKRLADGWSAINRFNEFTVESIRLVNQGDMSEYQANLQLVAPPDIPELKGLT